MINTFRNEAEVNQYIHNTFYMNSKCPEYRPEQLKDPAFIRENKNDIAKAMVYEWMKPHMKEYLSTSREVVPCYAVLSDASYYFDSARIPYYVDDKIGYVYKNLMGVTQKYLDSALTTENPTVDLKSLLKQPQYSSIDQAYAYFKNVEVYASSRQKGR